jgi:hypothetical protein
VLLERHLQQRWKAGERDPEELTCAGLAFSNEFLARPNRTTETICDQRACLNG